MLVNLKLFIVVSSTFGITYFKLQSEILPSYMNISLIKDHLLQTKMCVHTRMLTLPPQYAQYLHHINVFCHKYGSLVIVNLFGTWTKMIKCHMVGKCLTTIEDCKMSLHNIYSFCGVMLRCS